jgi:hypothetical protein
MKIQMLFVALHIGFAGLLSWAVICPVYAQGGQVREIGLPATGGSSDTSVNASIQIQFPIQITEPGNYRLNTNFVGAGPTSTVISIESSDVTLDLNGFSISGPNAGIRGSGRNIAISNGSISVGDGQAVGLSGSNCSIEGLRIFGSRDGIVLTGTDGTDGTEGTNCIVKNNTVSAFRVGILCSGCVVSGNTVTATNGNAIMAGNSSLVVGNRAIGSNIALTANDTTGYAQNILNGGATADVTGGVQIGENLCVTSKICPP